MISHSTLNKIIISFVILSGFCKSAQSSELYFFDFTFSEKNRISKIYKKFILKGKKIRRNDPGLLKTTSSNPHIKNWKVIKTNETLKLYITKEKADLKLIKAYLSTFTPPRVLFDTANPVKKVKAPTTKKSPLKPKPIVKKPTAKKPKTKKKKVAIKKRKRRRIKDYFYAGVLSSKSIYTEELTNKLNVEYDQNSFIGLNLGYKRIINNRWFFLNDLKFSYIQKASLEGGSNGESSIPPEIVNTTAVLYKIKKYRIYPFLGLEYNKFSTFDLEKNFANSSVVELINHHIFLLKIGLNYNFKTFRRNSTLSAGFAIKALHVSDFNSDNAIKPQISYGIRFKKKFRYFLNYSLLSMSGDTEVTRNRISTGIVYFIF